MSRSLRACMAWTAVTLSCVVACGGDDSSPGGGGSSGTGGAGTGASSGSGGTGGAAGASTGGAAGAGTGGSSTGGAAGGGSGGAAGAGTGGSSTGGAGGACSTPTPVGSCDNPTPSVQYCVDFYVGDVATNKAGCEANKARTFTAGKPCSAGGRVGKCVLTGQSQSYYKPNPQYESICKSQNGTWCPG